MAGRDKVALTAEVDEDRDGEDAETSVLDARVSAKTLQVHLAKAKPADTISEARTIQPMSSTYTVTAPRNDRTKQPSSGERLAVSDIQHQPLKPNRPDKFCNQFGNFGVPASFGIGIVIEHQKMITARLHRPSHPTIHAEFV